MGKVLIVAMDEMYQGMHGMSSYEFFDEGMTALQEAGIEMSLEVINNYDEIMTQIEEEAMAEVDFSDGEMDYDEVLEEMISDDVLFNIYKVVDEIADKTDRELEEMYSEDPDGFIENYTTEF